jgi:light-harvesting complex 1 alpha chain
MADQIAKPSNPADDWKIWLVLNPADWLIPIFMALAALAVIIHVLVFTRGMAFALAPGVV